MLTGVTACCCCPPGRWLGRSSGKQSRRRPALGQLQADSCITNRVKAGWATKVLTVDQTVTNQADGSEEAGWSNAECSMLLGWMA